MSSCSLLSFTFGSKQSRRGERRSLDHRDDDSPLPALVALGWRDTNTATEISQETEVTHTVGKEELSPFGSVDGLHLRIQISYLKDW